LSADVVECNAHLAGTAPPVRVRQLTWPLSGRLCCHPLKIVVAVVVAALVLAGCSTGGENPAAVAGADGGAGSGVAKEVVIAISGDEGTLTPYTQKGAWGSLRTARGHSLDQRPGG